MKIGDLVYHNPVFLVAPPDREVDSVFTFDGVLSYHFIRDAKEIIINNETGRFIFPQKASDGKANMFLSSNTPHVRISYNGQPFDLIFDTGNIKSNLGSKFAKTFTDTIEGLTKQASSLGGTNTSEVGEFRIISLDFNDGDWRLRWKYQNQQRPFSSRARYNCDRSYCKIPDFTLTKLGIIPDFVL